MENINECGLWMFHAEEFYIYFKSNDIIKLNSLAKELKILGYKFKEVDNQLKSLPANSKEFLLKMNNDKKDLKIIALSEYQENDESEVYDSDEFLSYLINRKKERKSYTRISFDVWSQDEAKKWKKFWRKYFPNCRAKKMLDEDIVIDVDGARSGKGHESKLIAVTLDGYGFTTSRLSYYSGDKDIINFEEFKDTLLYKEIVKRGPILETNEPDFVFIPFGK